jgi:hypothetical protein
LRAAPPGRRFEVVRRVRGAIQQEKPAGAARYFDVGEFKSFEQFEIKYRQLAEELGCPGKIPAPGELDFLHAMVDLDDVRYPGGIGSRDYFFLTALVSILAPRRVIEIGTLTGFSTAIIAAAIHRQHGAGLPPGRREITVETIDAHTHCSIDETKPIGFEIPALVQDLAATVRVLDVLRLAPYVQGGGWILLHDIQLGTYGRNEREAGQSLEGGTPYGAEWLFDAWPFRKIRSFHIGAIELPARKIALVPFALDLMGQPFEVTGKAAERIRRALYRSFIDLV